jgi:hypothetical protein
MQEYIEIYRANQGDIENFLKETINNLGELSENESSEYTKIFDIFPSLELVYKCDEKTLLQTSANIYRKKTSKIQIGNNRKYLLDKFDFNDKDISVTQPYLSSATTSTCITVAKIQNGQIYFMDFNLKTLLQRLGFLEMQKEFNFINKAFYSVTANIMMLLAIFTVGYAAYDFAHALFINAHISIEAIFKPVIALTLGLAIYDLAKTVMEQEVVFKSYSKDTRSEYRVLIKFSITIIIALLIEALMVVFKIALDNYSAMIHALYLISAVAILITSLGFFIYFTKKKAK